MTHLEFQAHKREEEREEVTFGITGQKRTKVDDGFQMLDHTETFTCLKVAPAGTMQHFARTGDMVEFIAGLLVPEDEPRWREIIHSKDFIVESDTVIDICNRLAEVFTGRPIKPSTG